MATSLPKTKKTLDCARIDHARNDQSHQQTGQGGGETPKMERAICWQRTVIGHLETLHQRLFGTRRRHSAGVGRAETGPNIGLHRQNGQNRSTCPGEPKTHQSRLKHSEPGPRRCGECGLSRHQWNDRQCVERNGSPSGRVERRQGKTIQFFTCQCISQLESHCSTTQEQCKCPIRSTP